MARKQKQPSWWIAVSVLVIGLFSLLGKLQLSPTTTPTDPTAKTEQNSTDTIPISLPKERSADKIRIASFNIQVFGQSKLSKPTVIRRLASIIRQFDLVAIQEIRSADQNLIPEFLRIVNDQGDNYRYLLGERLGRTVSKEQYAFLYRSSILEPVPGSNYNIEDRQDRIHREPLVGTFSVRSTPSGRPFTFTLINAHTDPDEAEWEVSQLAEVYKFVTSYTSNEDDILLLGDLNVDNSKLGPLTAIPLLRPVTGNAPTNTRGTKQYDHILVNHQHTSEFTGKAGVFDMARFLQISEAEALELSDHLPVWAEFTAYEQASPIQVATPFDDRTIR